MRSIAEADIAASVKVVRDANAKLAGSVEPLIQDKLRVLTSAHALATKLGNQEEIACPACGQCVPVEKFRDHIAAEQSRLGDIISSFEARKNAIAVLIDHLRVLRGSVLNVHVKAWLEEARAGPNSTYLAWIATLAPETFRQALDGKALTTIETAVSRIVAAAEEASKKDPPEAREIARDQATVEATKLVLQARRISVEIAEIDELTGFLASLERAIRVQIRKRSQAAIGDISSDISEMWEILHPDEPIENVRLIIPENDKAIDVGLRFHGQEQDSPRLTLSEGYRNSLGLCIFLAMARREEFKQRPLFLDDVVVSLDRNHRGMIAEVLEKKFHDRQVVLLTHDRVWYSELKHVLPSSRWSFKTLLPYVSPDVGIRWSHKTTTFDDARAHLQDRPDSAGNDARKIMDSELGLIAEKLEILLPFVRGERNDHRMAHDFLERLKSEGRNRFRKRVDGRYVPHDEAVALFQLVHSLLLSWGNRSSHSQDLVRREAKRLIEECEKVLELFRCLECKKPIWYANAGGPENVQCQCGALLWKYKS